MIYIGHVPRRKSVAIGITENGRTRIVAYCRSEDDAEDLLIALEHALQVARETAVKRARLDADRRTGRTALARGLEAAAARRELGIDDPFSHARARAD
jgi:hypothetical protein